MTIAWYDPTNHHVSTDKNDPLFTPLGQLWPLDVQRTWVGLTPEEAQAMMLAMSSKNKVKKLSESTARSTIAMMRSMASHIPISPFHNMASDQMESLLNEVLKHRSKK